MTKQRVLEGVKVGDPVIVSYSELDPDRNRRTVRRVDIVTRVFKRVIQTECLDGIDISTGQCSLDWTERANVSPASGDDVAAVNSELAAMEIADAERIEQMKIEKAERGRANVLRGKIRECYLNVPEVVLIRALAVLRGEERAGE